MTLGSPDQPWQRRGNYSQIASAAIAGVALAVVWSQLQTIKTNNRDSAQKARESAARQMFRSHIEIELKYPNLAEPDYRHLKRSGGVDFGQYTSFVTHLLYTCEEVLIAMGDEQGWRSACQSRMGEHSQYLCETLADVDLVTYGEQVQELVAITRRDASSRFAECERWKTSK
ncbi:hypothetical protein LPW26_19970 [Rhodopseudomonas sp. HC1]|uniref:hypothetical protein n=1 Tax=Rhodopseudomonas infernalis TaxID=2897386 RepID=UPI001EE8C961|nr:hypothetical protein [Rhodopseudomonas infernalis]MCG6206928.1 hypothetical protein [Rhodopseudomonas infernalis]